MDDIDDNDSNTTQSKARMDDNHKRLRNNSEQGVKVQTSINQFIGRNFAYKPVVVDEKVRLGQRMQVEITEVTTRGLYGTSLS